MKKTFTILFASTALAVGVGLPAWSAMHGRTAAQHLARPSRTPPMRARACCSRAMTATFPGIIDAASAVATIMAKAIITVTMKAKTKTKMMTMMTTAPGAVPRSDPLGRAQ